MAGRGLTKAGRSGRGFRPAGFDELGLRRALAGRILPFLVAAMAFLAALALTGFVGAASLAQHWREGAGAVLTVQVPQPTGLAAQGGGNRLDRAVALLDATPGLMQVHALSDDELSELLRPWLGGVGLGGVGLGGVGLGGAKGAERLALPLPGVIRVRMTEPTPDLDALGRRLEAVAPGTLVESHRIWVRRLSALARSLQACAGAALLIVIAVAATVVAVATRAGLTARREAIEIVHGLGATDGYIAGRFAGRATLLAAMGGLLGALAALPVLLGLAHLAAPFVGGEVAAGQPILVFAVLPPVLWFALPGLPLTAAVIGFLTAQATVRGWLRRLP
jgi:cell division transport system permease protein